MSSTCGLEILDTWRSTDSAIVVLSWLLPWASTARAVAMATFAISTSLALTGSCSSSPPAAEPLRITSRISCAREARSTMSIKGYTDSTSSSNTASSRAISPGVQRSQKSASDVGGSAGDWAPLGGGDSNVGMPMRVRERSPTMRPNDGLVGPTNCGCFGAASLCAVEGDCAMVVSGDCSDADGGRGVSCLSCWTVPTRSATCWRSCAMSSLRYRTCSLLVRASVLWASSSGFVFGLRLLGFVGQGSGVRGHLWFLCLVAGGGPDA